MLLLLLGVGFSICKDLRKSTVKEENAWGSLWFGLPSRQQNDTSCKYKSIYYIRASCIIYLYEVQPYRGTVSPVGKSPVPQCPPVSPSVPQCPSVSWSWHHCSPLSWWPHPPPSVLRSHESFSRKLPTVGRCWLPGAAERWGDWRCWNRQGTSWCLVQLCSRLEFTSIFSPPVQSLSGILQWFFKVL